MRRAHRVTMTTATLILGFLTIIGCDEAANEPAVLEGPVPESQAKSEVARRLCYAYRECRCGELAGVSLAGCDLGMGYAWEASAEDAAEQGLTFDGDCLSRRLNAMAGRGCDSMIEGVNPPGCTGETCLIYHGDVAEGGACEGGMSSSNCQQGLVCFGSCEPPCLGVPLPLGAGVRCIQDGTPTGVCDLGLLCDPTTELCAAPGTDGEPCAAGVCAEWHWCDPSSGSGVCKAQITQGDCTLPQECQSMSCTGSICNAMPREGDPCPYQRCEGELVCADDGSGTFVCQTVPGTGEPCLAGYLRRCQTGLACVNDVCTSAPRDGEACLDPVETGLLSGCGKGLVCGAKLCSLSPSAPGCDACDEPPDSCMVRVCSTPPPAVCGDSGGLLF